MADLSNLSDDDLKAIAAGDMSKVSDDGLKHLVSGGAAPAPKTEDRTLWQAMKDAFKRGVIDQPYDSDASSFFPAPRDAAEGARTSKQLVQVAPNGVRVAGAVMGAEGGPTGAGINTGAEGLAQLMEGKMDKGKLATTAGVSFVPLGSGKSIASILGNVAKMGTAGVVAPQVESLINDQKLAPAGESLKQGGISAAIPAIAPVVGKIMGSLTHNISPEQASKIEQLLADNAPSDRVLSAMQERGASAVPSSVNPSFLNKTLESAAGIQNVEGAVARNNLPVYRSIAREEASLGPQAPLDAENLGKARAQIAKTSYDLAEQNGFSKELDDWREATTEYKAAERERSKGYTNGRGDAVDAAAANLNQTERALDRAAKKAGVSADFNEAKKAFAKNYDVEEATPSGTGSISPGLLSAMERNRDTGGMSGGLRDIAEFSNAFGRSSKDANKMATSPGAASAGASTALLTDPDPTRQAAGLLSFLRGPLAERLASSDYQAGRGILGTLSGGARRNYTPATSADPKTTAAMTRAAEQLANEMRSDSIKRALQKQGR